MSRPPALPLFQSAAFGSGVRADLMIRCGILCLLAAKRRESPDIGALNALDLERMMGIARTHLRFAFWYLKSKLYIKQDDRSSMGITAEGLDYLESILAGDELLQKIYLAADTSIHT
jgi:hypothetical protein